MLGPKLRFGAFIAPFHAMDENPGLALERDLELVAYLEKLGYDEAWIGEHHSAGMEIIASPELFIATVAERTARIRLGTGVSSVPYHHPLMLAERFNQLDHITRGRVMLGMGPGSLPSDAAMMGIDVARQRDMLYEAMEAIVPLLRGETVTMKTDWFELIDARLQMTPYSRPAIEMVSASSVSPTGARAAGRYGIGLLSVAATSMAGFNALASNWAIAEDVARDHGQAMDRGAWRLNGLIHIAETREKARANVQFGLMNWLRYFGEVAALPAAGTAFGGDAVDGLVESGMAAIGTPDDAIAQIKRLQAESGGFGCFLHLAHNWADWTETKRSYELFARYVFPAFQNLNDNREASTEWAMANRPKFVEQMQSAIGARVVRYVEEKGSENIHPDILAATMPKPEAAE
jgi:limonene 1,2-monooxygenase